MTNTDVVFAGSIPEFYDTYMVPLIFEVYAADLASRVAALAPMAVLETAAGTGVVARADREAASVGSARDHGPEPPDARSRSQPAGARRPDRMATGGYAGAAVRRPVFRCRHLSVWRDVLPGPDEGLRGGAPGAEGRGRFICSVWDRIENNKFADVVTKAAATVFPDGPALFTARTPHGHFDHDLIRADLNRAGFTDIVINSKEETSKAPSARHAAIALCQGTPRRSEIETRDRDSLEHVMEVAAVALEAICGKDAVAAKISAHIVTAVK